MNLRTRFSIGTLLLALVVLNVIPAAAQTTQDTPYVVQPGDSLFRIAQRYGTTVLAIVQANNISDPNLIFAGQTLIIPSGSGVAVAPVAPGAPAAPPISPASGAWSVEVGRPIYSGDGQVVDIPITIHNNSITPAIAGGRYTSTLKPDGNYEDAALMKARHGTFEEPLVGNALMWQAIVHLSDGTTHFMTAGCRFINHVYATGDEPLVRDAQGVWLEWFTYEINLYDGWFDCGNTLRINPPNIVPGTSGSSVVKVYLVNPYQREEFNRIVGTAYPGRTVTRLDVTVFRQDGSVVGTQTVNVPAP